MYGYLSTGKKQKKHFVLLVSKMVSYWESLLQNTVQLMELILVIYR